MMTNCMGRFVLSAALAGFASPLAADPAMPPTDANLITVIDVSGSIDAETEALEFDGIAEAITHPAFLQTVAAGFHGRVGFAAFTWSSRGEFAMLLPWSLIDSTTSAAGLARQLLSALGNPRFAYSTPSPGSARRAWRRGLETDISAAIEHATGLLASAPFAATNEVMNILANGPDNVAAGPDAARDRALAGGAVINGVALGDVPGLADYLREHVQGGPSSFVLEARRPADIAVVMRKKFLLDLVGPPPENRGAGRGSGWAEGRQPPPAIADGHPLT